MSNNDHDFAFWLAIYENFTVERIADRLVDPKKGATHGGVLQSWWNSPARIEALAVALAKKRLGVD